MSWLIFFTDPILRGPTIGCILLGILSALIGVTLFLNKKLLLAEALSHASYPGVVLSMSLLSFFALDEPWGFFTALIGAFFSSYLALWVIHFLSKKHKVPADAALCFVLSSFFGLGLLFVSHIQVSMASMYRKIQIFLYGQAATMGDFHVLMYAVICLSLVAFVLIYFRKLQVFLFDREYAKSIGINVLRIENMIFAFLVLAIIVGIRSVGIVLMSAMLISPCVFARQFTDRLSIFFILSACANAAFAFFGNLFSVELSKRFLVDGQTLSVPTGPVIVLLGCFFAVLALLFSPKKGLVTRVHRANRFKRKCMQENILKAIWKMPSKQANERELSQKIHLPYLRLKRSLYQLRSQGWLEKENEGYQLTKDGLNKALQIIRLHRLWEVYLANYLGFQKEKVHHSAEEMEHIITPDLEEKLEKFLSYPTKDPHKQPIPAKLIPGKMIPKKSTSTKLVSKKTISEEVL